MGKKREQLKEKQQLREQFTFSNTEQPVCFIRQSIQIIFKLLDLSFVNGSSVSFTHDKNVKSDKTCFHGRLRSLNVHLKWKDDWSDSRERKRAELFLK